MILIYSKNTSSRLQYICQFIFKEQLGITYAITLEEQSFNEHTGPKINYSHQKFTNESFTIQNIDLLFKIVIEPVTINCFDVHSYKAFFGIEESSFPFDIFAATFYLLTRYEEYLPHPEDMYGRYAHEASLACKEGFLEQPLINIWLNDFKRSLLDNFPEMEFKKNEFSFLPTYDIDIAYAFKNKGLIRNVGGFLKSPSMERINVLLRLKKDPDDAYDFLHALHETHKLKPIYFFLVATMASEYDKNISPYAYPMWQLIKQHAKKYTIGVHPSWRSFGKPALIKKEKRILETISNSVVVRSRQHYIKLKMPYTFEHLIDAGITEDYSMGYGSINGFRASVASSFYWYNLRTEKMTNLRLHPFCFMDANSYYEQKQNAENTLEELMHYYDVCKKAGGNLITIFHNNFLGESVRFKDWKALYVKFTTRLQQ